jgi:hypothetical protein
MGISTPARDWLFIELLETTGAIEWSFNMKSFGNGSSVVAPRLDLNPLPPEDLDEVETGVKDLKKSKSKKVNFVPAIISRKIPNITKLIAK